MYVGTPGNCSLHFGGGATGQVSLSANGGSLGTYSLDSSGELTFSTAQFAPFPGVFAVLASYSGDTNYTPLQLNLALAITGGKMSLTSETLSCTPYEILQGNAATCTVHLPAGATGSVQFTVNGTSQTVPVDSSGTASLPGLLSGVGVGSYVVQVQYSGDPNYASFTTTTSVSVQSVKPLPSRFSLGCVPAPLTAGETASCTAHVRGGASGQIFLSVDGATVTGLMNLDATGTVTISNLFANLSPGAHSIAASYLGDSNFSAATAGTSLNVVGSEPQTSMSLACTPVGLTVNQSGTCTARLNPGASGAVSFQVDNEDWITVPLSSGAATTPAGLQTLTAGTHSILASYSGDADFAGASATTTLSVSAQPNVTPSVQFRCAPSVIVSGQATTCTAMVDAGATGTLLLYNGPDLAGSAGLDMYGKAVFQAVLAGAAPGSYDIGAHYLGDVNFNANSANSGGHTTVQVVTQPSVSTVHAKVTPETIAGGGQLQLSAWVASGASGTVLIASNNQSLGQVSLNDRGGASSLIMFDPASGPGTYPITFTYSGDPNFQGSSTTVNVTVTSAAPPACSVE